MKRRIAVICIIMLSIFLGACNNKNNNDSDGQKVDVYYVDSKTSGLVSESYELIGTKTKDQIDELLYMLKKAPANAVYKSAWPNNTKANYNFENITGYLTINFDTSYSKFSGVMEVLCRAAIVKTICQINNVKYIQFSVDEQPLKDSDGNPIGTLTAEDFIDNTENNTSYKAKLYFANRNGDALIEYFTDINYTGAEAIEELVINQLINGPTEAGMYSTIPEGTILLNVSKADGICTVDFNEKFLDKLPDINEDIAIYSVVNTLAELPNINKVQFTINSKVVKTYWEDISLDSTFERKLGLDENPN
ncbi:MAG: GerMN domain-containing protein [Herbinix sp.]|nr:GerMN domain-containing protein [Herbinix sp.]